MNYNVLPPAYDDDAEPAEATASPQLPALFSFTDHKGKVIIAKHCEDNDENRKKLVVALS